MNPSRLIRNGIVGKGKEMYIVRKYSLSNAAILRNWIDRSEITEPNKKRNNLLTKLKPFFPNLY